MFFLLGRSFILTVNEKKTAVGCCFVVRQGFVFDSKNEEILLSKQGRVFVTFVSLD